VFVQLYKLVVILALVFSIGLHWALLQTVAWTGMIISYTQEGTLQEALTKTFDGQHPCALCTQIDQGRKSEKKSDLKINGKQLEFIESRPEMVFSPSISIALVCRYAESSPQFSLAPPVPPPRLA
jgi:hypothetical protein